MNAGFPVCLRLGTVYLKQEKALKTELARLRKEAEDNRTQAELAEAKSII